MKKIISLLIISLLLNSCNHPEEHVNSTVSQENTSEITIQEEGKKNHRFKSKIEWVVAPAEDLPFTDNTFDAYLVSFGVRNFSDIKRSLSEAYRVLKPGGKFFCLEFSKVENKTVSSIYNMYSSIIPVIGKVIVGDEEPYKYLTKTIDEFPSQKEIKEIIESTEFTDVNYKNIFNGIVAIHCATKAVNAE